MKDLNIDHNEQQETLLAIRRDILQQEFIDRSM